MAIYGIEYWSMNKMGCTTGESNDATGRMSIACNIEKFDSKEDREEWLFDSTYSLPRIAASKRVCREHCLGMSVKSFNEFM